MAVCATGVSLLRSVYDVDTLDTRLTTPSTAPYRGSAGSKSDKKDGVVSTRTPHPKAEPSRWMTPEYLFYGFLFIITVPYMFWIAYDVSRPSNPSWWKFQKYLWPGWMFGRRIDLSDPQYSTFRLNLPFIAILIAVHPTLRRFIARFLEPSHGSSSAGATVHIGPEQIGAARLQKRINFDSYFAMFFLTLLHGFSLVKIMLILWINYQLCMNLQRKYIPVATWVFNIAILFANELCDGYHFGAVAKLLTPSVLLEDPQANPLLVAVGNWLDSWSGLMPRWQILFNITVLRMISFNLDYYWSHRTTADSPMETSNLSRKKQIDPTCLSERDRITIPARASEFNFQTFIAYTLYAPLYLAGPILTFNDYIAQCKVTPLTIEPRRTLAYGVRCLLALLALEFVLHFDYVVAISRSQPVWSKYTPAQLSLLSYFNLHIIWLKLLIPFRIFRLWALLDGIDPPENMIRCISNNYSTLMFWRAWHRSYNRWLLRYIYIPLGGVNFTTWRKTARSIMTYVVVFTFVALWHDIQLRLLIWGWLVVLFFIPEIAARYLFPRRKFENRPETFRALRAIGTVGNILMMMIANMVGFAVGLDGLQSIVEGIFKDYHGFLFLIVACACIYVGVQVMYEIRQHELRRGIDMKC